MRCQLRPAAHAGPVARRLGLRGVRHKAAVLALGGLYTAHGAAVDAGGGHAGKKATVKARIAAEGRLVVLVV